MIFRTQSFKSKHRSNFEYATLEDRALLANYALFVAGLGGQRTEYIPAQVESFLADNAFEIKYASWNSFDVPRGTDVGDPGSFEPRIGSSFGIGPFSVPFVGQIGPFSIPQFLSLEVNLGAPNTSNEFLVDAKAWLDTLGNSDTIILMGHSLGGNAVLELARSVSVEIDVLALFDPVGYSDRVDAGIVNTIPAIINSQLPGFGAIVGIGSPGGLVNDNGQVPGFRKSSIFGGGLKAVPNNVKYFFNRWQNNAQFPLDFGASGELPSLASNNDQKSQNSGPRFRLNDIADDPALSLAYVTGNYDGDAFTYSEVDTLIFGKRRVVSGFNSNFLRSTAQLHHNFPTNQTVQSDLLSVIDGLLPPVIQGTSSSDQIVIKTVPASSQIEITVNGVARLEPAAAGLRVNALGGDDQITLDLALGLESGTNLFVDGGSGSDILNVKGGSFSFGKLEALGPFEGLLSIGSSKFAYDNMQEVRSSTNFDQLNFVSTTGRDRVNIVNGIQDAGLSFLSISSGSAKRFVDLSLTNSKTIKIDGSSGNDFFVVDYSIRPTRLDRLVVEAGFGNDFIGITATSSGVITSLIDEKSFLEQVNRVEVGYLRERTDRILGELAITARSTFVDLKILDSLNLSSRSVGIGAGSIDGVAPGRITFAALDVRSLNVQLGKGSDFVSVSLSSNPIVALKDLELSLGDGDDKVTVNENGTTQLQVSGGIGSDTLSGSNKPGSFIINGSGKGNISYGIEFSQIENLSGGNKLDRFVFTTDASSIESIDGGVGADIIDYSARSSVVAGVNTLGDGSGANGFHGFGTAISSGFRNIGQIIGSALGINDVLGGANLDSIWNFNPAGSSYSTSGRSLTFRNFETLVGRDQKDSFFVKAPTASGLTIIGGNPTTIPGDRLKVDLTDPINPQWIYFSPGAGRFTFDNRQPITYSQIETLENFDFGDAPETFATTTAANGARHRLGSPLRLGSRLDPEADGLPSAAANGDDSTGSPDDEDGVQLPATLIAHFRAAANVVASHVSRLDAWVDFNRDGFFSVAEKIANNLYLNAGSNRVEFYVPWENTVGGVAIARFRVSSAGGLASTGIAEDGEVEDYTVNISKVTPGTAALLPDPFHPGTSQTMLVMAGTVANDTIVINPDNQGRYEVRTNGQLTYRAPGANINRIGAFGLGGHDTIVVTSTMMNASELYGDDGNDDLFGGALDDYSRGGNGNDRLFGHNGHDLLYGDWGDDQLFGHEGNDILSGGEGSDRLFGMSGMDALFGGAGEDWLYGQTDEDIFVGNSSSYDNNERALNRIRNAWTRPVSYAMRVEQLRNGTAPGLAGVRLQWILTVFDDGSRDRLFGGFQNDWFVGLGIHDILQDRDASEAIS